MPPKAKRQRWSGSAAAAQAQQRHDRSERNERSAAERSKSASLASSPRSSVGSVGGFSGLSATSRGSLGRRSLQSAAGLNAESQFFQDSLMPPVRWLREDDDKEDPINKCDLRIGRISDQLSRIHLHIDTNREGLVNYVSENLDLMSFRLKDSRAIFEGSLRGIKDDVQKLEDGFEMEQQLMDESLHTETWNVGDRFDTILEVFLQKQRKIRAECEKDTIEKFGERLVAMVDYFDAEKNSRTRQDRERMLDNYINIDLPQLFNDHEKMRDEREEMENNIVRMASEQIIQLQEAVHSVRQQRETSENAMRKMISDVVSQVQEELEQEREERLKMEESMLKLIDLAADRLQKCPRFSDTVTALKQVVERHTQDPLPSPAPRKKRAESAEKSNTKRPIDHLSTVRRR